MLVVSCHMGIAKTALLIGAGFLAGLLVGRQLHPTNEEVEQHSPMVSSESGAMLNEAQEVGEPTRKAAADSAISDASSPITFDELASEMGRLRMLDSGSEEESSGWDNLKKRLKSSDLQALAKALLDNYPGAASEDAIGMVFWEFARQKPDEAWQMMLTIKNPDLRSQTGWSVAQALAEMDVGKTLNLINRLPRSSFKTDLRRAALSTLASRDPAKAFALEVEYAGNEPDFDPANVLWEWVKRDPGAAVAAVSSLRGQPAKTAASALISTLASREPIKAWEFAQRLPRSSADPYSDPRYTALSSWGRADPETAMSIALTLEDTQLKNYVVEDIARQWADQDFASALSYFANLSDANSRAKGLVAMSSSSQPNRAELFAALQQYGPVGDNYSAMNLLREWAKQDPSAAADALGQMAPSPMQEQAVLEFVRGWISSADSSATDVVAWASSLAGESARSSAIHAAFEELAKQDASSASKLLAEAPSALQTTAVRGLAAGWSESDPEKAAAWAGALPETEREAAFYEIMGAWARRAPERAAAFAQTHDKNGQLVSSVANEWLPYAPEQAAAWVDKLPAGDVRDTGLMRVAEIISREDPGAAALWAQRISSAPQREEQLQNICGQWISVDPVAAKAWISTSKLSAEAKQSLLSR